MSKRAAAEWMSHDVSLLEKRANEPLTSEWATMLSFLAQYKEHRLSFVDKTKEVNIQNFQIKAGNCNYFAKKSKGQ